MQLQSKGNSSLNCHRDEVTRKVALFKAIPAFELSKFALGFISKAELAIYQTRHAPIARHLNRLREERILGFLIVVRNFRQDLHNPCVPVDIGDLHEPDEFLIVISADEVAPIKIRPKLLLYRVYIFPKMPKA